MHGRVSPNCSFTWRSIMWSKDMLEKGLRWHVGNGKHIKNFEDRWVQGLHEGRPQGKPRHICNSQTVNHLMGANGEWNVELLHELFLSHEVQAILQTPSGEMGTEDERGWAYEAKGSFTVKSAYRSQLGSAFSQEGTSTPDRRWWNRHVWSSATPPKTRIFLWRAMNNILLTMANLKRQHVPVDGICSSCGDRWASTEHTLFFRHVVRRIWKASRFWQILKYGTAAGLRDIAEIIRRELKDTDYDLWCLMAWQIWSYLCQKSQEEDRNVSPPTEQGCAVMGEEYNKAQVTLMKPLLLGVKMGTRTWSRPPKGVCRVDVDALHNPDSLLFGVGVIIRNEDGGIVAARSKRTPPRSSVMLAELLAIVEGVVLAVEH